MADSMVSAVSARSVAVNPNAGVYSAPAAASFSSGLFDQTWKPVQNAQGQSQYDIARTTAETAAQRAQALRSGALQRQLAGQGLSDSGIALKQGQLLNQDVQSSLQSGIAGVNTAELANAEAARQAAIGRQYGAETNQYLAAQQTSERLGAQAFTAELTYADLNQKERTLAENARQFNSAQDFQRWATERGYTNDEAVRAWQADQNEKNRSATKDVAGMQIGSSEKIASMNIASNEKINANKDALTAQGLSIEAAQVYGFTDSNGNHVAGSLENAAAALGLQAKTLEEQQKELWGWTDANGVRHQGKYDLMSNEDKRAADSLYGTTLPDGSRIHGTLESQAIVADATAKNAQANIDSLHGYTDPTTGEKIKGSLEVAQGYFGLKSRELADQEAELFGTYDQQTGEWLPGRLASASAADKRAADALYGYVDATTGERMMGAMEIQQHRLEIEQQGLTLDEARLKGWTGADGKHHMGTEELAVKQMEVQKEVVKLQGEIQSGLMDKQALIDLDKTIQTTKAQQYYTRGQSGEVLDAATLNYLVTSDPLAYESYMDGKAGKQWADVQKTVDLTNQYRQAMINTIDDPDLQYESAKLFREWFSDAGMSIPWQMTNEIVQGTSRNNPEKRTTYSPVTVVKK
jgi:hypothetical protein